MKVHILINKDLIVTDLEKKEFVLGLKYFGFSCTNIKRFLEFDMLTGEVDELGVEKLKSVIGIVSVVRDGIK